MIPPSFVSALIVSTSVSLTAAGASPAQSATKEAAPLASRIAETPVSDLLQAASDLRQAAEALARFGETVQSVSGGLATSLERTAQHLAQITSGFDPLGLQAAFRVIERQHEALQEQHRRLEQLQRQQTRRLRREVRELRQELERLRGPSPP